MSSETHVEQAAWGQTPSGVALTCFTLSNESLRVQVVSYGARVISVQSKDKDGVVGEVTLGADNIDPYLTDTAYLGATIGRVGNRIAKGTFELDGVTYTVPLNDGPNALHGGTDGFDKKVWDAAIVPDGVQFSYTSPDGEMGFPGTLKVLVNYTLVDNGLRIDYEATTDKSTVVSLTNHTYWNLGGDVAAHTMRVDGSNITPGDATLITTGELMPVDGTVFDLRTAKTIGDGWDSSDPQIQLAGGYDHNWALADENHQLNLAAEAHSPTSGRTMTVMTTEPGIQFYSGNFLNNTFAGRDGLLARRSGFCLETQQFPDSPNKPSFPSSRLDPGTVLRSTTVYIFTAA